VTAARVVHRHCIHAVHQLGGHVVAARVLHHVRDGRDPLEGRPHPVAIVLAAEDDRQLVDRGHVERLVEGTDIDCRLPEKADANLITTSIADREPQARGEG